MSSEYQKIPNIYKRETYGKNRLMEGKYTTPYLEYLSGNEWEWTEKVDGTNIRVIWDGYRVELKGRTDRAEIPKHLNARLEELFCGNAKEELFESTFGNKTVIMYGEGFGEKIQNGGLYGKVDFILFDIYIDGFWLKRSALDGIADVFGIKTVPIVGSGTLVEAVEYIKNHPKSKLREAELEGIVCRPKQEILERNGERIIVKIKCCDFPERRRAWLNR